MLNKRLIKQHRRDIQNFIIIIIKIITTTNHRMIILGTVLLEVFKIFIKIILYKN